MDEVGRRNWLKVFLIPLLVALALARVGIAIFERVTGIGNALSAYREGEEKCQKYGLVVTAEALNLEYNSVGAENSGTKIKQLLNEFWGNEAWRRALRGSSYQSKLLDNSADRALTDPREVSLVRPLLEKFWHSAEPILVQGQCRFVRDFREGPLMVSPEYSSVSRLCTLTLNDAIFTSDSGVALTALKHVAKIRAALGDNFDLPSVPAIQRSILRDEMTLVAKLLKENPKKAEVVRHAEELMLADPKPRGMEFRLKAQLHSVLKFDLTDNKTSAVLENWGLRSKDQLWVDWNKWRKYPRIGTAWRSAALMSAAKSYEQLKADFPITVEDEFDWQMFWFNSSAVFGDIPGIGCRITNRPLITSGYTFQLAKGALKKALPQ